MKTLVINPGSTSTKVAVFDGDKKVCKETIRHRAKDLKKFDELIEQLPFRKQMIQTFLDSCEIPIEEIDGFIGRGGLMKPVKSGIYEVNAQMVTDMATCKYGEHASNLGGILAKEFADQFHKKAYIADPVVVDEMSSVAKISGLNGIQRRPLWHALNQKAVAKKYCETTKKTYDQSVLIVAHLGGGISVGLHKQGRVTDVNNALDGDGPFTPERTGGLPVGSVYELAYGGQYSIEQFRKLNHGYGGLVSYLGTNDAMEVSKMIADGHVLAKRVMKAMVYQIAKEIGALYAVTRGKLDAIILTGGLAYNDDVINPLTEYLEHMGNIIVYPGEGEMEALNYNLQQLEQGLITIRTY
ncbi:butyrate kinase [Candidatus Xianfuyuplasma coldseepsis]|uniref:Probable butyrate kinase n=1 Tax=Candidatus Xianfuyuplasma coldseepsis TaxID=2782163 RepID=A0A7L7KPF1_9MOLU|nr:butyrate kinase [Xianfuyuplasma coldseepsis]QMS84309.1 butyrate kinase [Xianfuyuplasma coldseepsis]